jgi:hypothetical protein
MNPETPYSHAESGSESVVSVEKVAERGAKLLESLDEALDQYTAVTIGERTYESESLYDQRVARAQRLREGVAGLLETIRENKPSREAEQAALMLEQVVTFYEGALKVEADASQLGPGSEELVMLMNKVALALLPLEQGSGR